MSDPAAIRAAVAARVATAVPGARDVSARAAPTKGDGLPAYHVGVERRGTRRLTMGENGPRQATDVATVNLWRSGENARDALSADLGALSDAILAAPADLGGLVDMLDVEASDIELVDEERRVGRASLAIRVDYLTGGRMTGREAQTSSAWARWANEVTKWRERVDADLAGLRADMGAIAAQLESLSRVHDHDADEVDELVGRELETLRRVGRMEAKLDAFCARHDFDRLEALVIKAEAALLRPSFAEQCLTTARRSFASTMGKVVTAILAAAVLALFGLQIAP
jgi:hypothetical protein